MTSAVLIAMTLLAVATAYPTTYISGDPQNRQFYYYNQPPNSHVIRTNYNYPPYNEYPYGNGNNYDYRFDPRYGVNGYGNGYNDPANYVQKYGYAQPNYGYVQPYYGGYNDPNAPSELRQDSPRKDDIDLSGFKMHHQHHPNKDRVGLKPGHDGGLHGVSFGNDGYGH